MEVEPHQYWDYDQFWRDNFSRLLRLQNSFYDLQLTSCSSSSSSVMAHRAILSRVSSYLHNILKTAPEEQTTSLTEILVPGFSLQALQLFVQICYEGRVVEAVTNTNCQKELVELAEFFHLDVEICDPDDSGDPFENEAAFSPDAGMEMPPSRRSSSISNSSTLRGDNLDSPAVPGSSPSEDENEDVSKNPRKNAAKIDVACPSDLQRNDFPHSKSTSVMKKEDPVSAHDQEPTLQRETKTIPSEMTPAVTARKKKKRVLTAQLHPEDLKCKECGKTFPVMYKLELHRLIHSKTFPFSCGICDKGFNNKYKMKVHERGHETRGETRESLKTSKEENTEKEERRKTMLLTNEKKLGVQMKHRDLNKCSECPSVFQTKSALDSHLSQDHPEYKGFLCSTCGKGFRRQKGLSHHNTYICPKPSARCHPCLDPSCSAKFNSPRDLRRHAKNKHSPSGARTQGAENERQRHWKCPDCPTVCSSGKSLRVHGRTAHPGTDGVGSLSFQCLQCPEGKMFLKQSYLEDHYNRFHSPVKQFPCMFCPKACSTKQDLDRHLTSHRGEPNFRCSQCPRTFVHRANFKQHEQRHAGVRPYKCIPCDKSFGLLCVLRKHQKSHERKGDATKIVTAPKGRRGCLSYIDFGEEEEEDDEQQEQQQTATVLTSALHPPQAYIPSAPQYVQSTYTITPLSQMQVLHGGAYGEEIVAVLDQGSIRNETAAFGTATIYQGQVVSDTTEEAESVTTMDIMGLLSESNCAPSSSAATTS